MVGVSFAARESNMRSVSYS